MLAIINSIALKGLEGVIVRVEVDVSNGLPGLDLVGLPDTSVRESKERVRAAIKNSGFEFPLKRITVNLAPADIRKEGSAYDLPIAIGVLAASQQISYEKCAQYIFLGELSLDGAIQWINGALPSVLVAYEHHWTHIVVPAENAAESSLIDNMKIYPASTLKALVEVINGEEVPTPYEPTHLDIVAHTSSEHADFSEVKGQLVAKRALEVAAAGGHNILMIGSPGSGKTMLARRLPSILPELTFEEALAVTKIHSINGLLKPNQALLNERPFRTPHHSASMISIIGGGRIPKPGEVSLSHNGVLFLDEILEFKKDLLESLRQPMEDGEVTITRVQSAITYPAQFMLVASANPCPCGWYGDQHRECSCTPLQIKRYLHRLSGPLLDRIDMHIEVAPVEYSDLESYQSGEGSKEIKSRVEAARKIQLRRYIQEKVNCNAHLSSELVRKYCAPSEGARILLKTAFKKLHLTARSHDKILKTARTIADLDASSSIEAQHMAEALQYRNLESHIY